MSGPLNGVTVVELGGIGPGQLAGMMLADMGAEVTRVERPGASGSFMPAEYDLLNRGKRSVVLDLKHPEAVEAVIELARTAQVFTEGFRPGVAERLGLGPDRLREVNPRLVYGRMTGWGQDGPLAQRAGHDVSYLALTGALHAIGPAAGPPQIPLSLVGDFGGGATYLVMGVLAALREADSTGCGQIVDAAIIDGTNHLLVAVRALMAAGQWVDRREANMFDGGSPFYSVYRTADNHYLAVGALEAPFFAELVRLLGVDVDLHRQHDRDYWPQMRQLFTEAFARHTRDQWVDVFAGSDACVSPVLSLAEAADDPQMAARGNHLEIGGVLQPAPAPKFSGHPGPIPTPPRPPGADTAEILARIGCAALIDTDAAPAVPGRADHRQL